MSYFLSYFNFPLVPSRDVQKTSRGSACFWRSFFFTLDTGGPHPPSEDIIHAPPFGDPYFWVSKTSISFRQERYSIIHYHFPLLLKGIPLGSDGTGGRPSRFYFFPELVSLGLFPFAVPPLKTLTSCAGLTSKFRTRLKTFFLQVFFLRPDTLERASFRAFPQKVLWRMKPRCLVLNLRRRFASFGRASGLPRIFSRGLPCAKPNNSGPSLHWDPFSSGIVLRAYFPPFWMSVTGRRIDLDASVFSPASFRKVFLVFLLSSRPSTPL